MSVLTAQPSEPASLTGPSFTEALRFWLLLGFVNFGGPAGQIATMHKELVERRKWIGEEAYLRGLNFCTLLPGPEAQQLATYIGWRLHGVRGGLVAGTLFVLPSVFILIALSWLSVAHAQVSVISGAFYGIQAIVIAVVLEAVLRIGKRALRHRALYLFAAAAFVMLALFSVPFPLVVLSAGLAGLLMQRRWPEVFARATTDAGAATRAADERDGSAYPSIWRAVRISAVFVALWVAPIGALLAWRGRHDLIVEEALFFTRAALITFGGAYAVLSFIADQAVNHYGWLSTEQMVQGLGLAETTPGPLIMVTQYVGFVGAYQHGGGTPFITGVLGAVVTTYVTFLPCFLFIFIGAPYIEALSGNRRIHAALTGITAAVVGVILNLAVFFARHVLFPNGKLDRFALVVAVIGFVAAWRFHLPIQYLVLAGAVAGVLWTILR